MTDNPVFARAAALYRVVGWLDTLPLPARQKSPPPDGFTGKRFADVDPTDDQVFAWALERPDANIALRLPDGIIGIDVDDYGSKAGGRSLVELEARLGPLPDTWRVTSRDDGVSGIRFFRVPKGLEWPSVAGPDIEMIHRGHRYSVVWPSIHPDTQGVYRWISPGGEDVLGVPCRPEELPEAPVAWVDDLTGRRQAKPAMDREDLEPDRRREVEQGILTQGAACSRVRERVLAALEDLSGPAGSRHDRMVGHTMAIITLGAKGHAGVAWAIESLEEQYLDVVGPDRQSTREAALEWQRMITGAIGIEAKQHRDLERCGGDHCGKATSLVDIGLVTADALPPATVPGEDIFADLSWLLTGRPPKVPPPSVGRRSDGNAIFYRGRINGIFGDPETAKSWIASWAIVEQLLAGERCAYLDVDHNGAEQVAWRLKRMGAPVEVLGNQDLFRVSSPETGGGLELFLNSMKVWQPAVVVVDSIGEIMPMLGLKSNENDDITRMIRGLLRPLADHAGSCVIAIDHLPKNSEARENGYAIGGVAKKRATDGAYLSAELLTEVAPGKAGKVVLRIEKDRNGKLRQWSKDGIAAEFVISDEGEETDVVIEATVAGRAQVRVSSQNVELMQEVSMLIEGSESMSTNAIFTSLGVGKNSGKAARGVQAALTALIEGKYVRVEAGPRRSKMHVSTRPYRVYEQILETATGVTGVASGVTGVTPVMREAETSGVRGVVPLKGDTPLHQSDSLGPDSKNTSGSTGVTDRWAGLDDE